MSVIDYWLISYWKRQLDVFIQKNCLNEKMTRSNTKAPSQLKQFINQIGTSTLHRAITTLTTTPFRQTLPHLDENRWVILETRKRSHCFTQKPSRTELSRIIFGTRPSPIFSFASRRPRTRRLHRRWCLMIQRPRWGHGILWGNKKKKKIANGMYVLSNYFKNVRFFIYL